MRLLRLTNAYNGRVMYIPQEKILYFEESQDKELRPRWAGRIQSVIYFDTSETGALFVVEPIEHLLNLFPPAD